MKTLISILLLLVSTQAYAHIHPQQDKPSTHGMAVVGTEKIYLSHLPMFHSPHDYQVLLEVEIDSKTLAIYKQSKKDSAETLYTLVPESFVLPEMIQNPKPFQAQLYKGHFERGGELISQNVQVKISHVLFFEKFDPKAVKPKEASYILFGNTSEKFMAHLITAKPDFDQILSVDSQNLDLEEGALILQLKDQSNENPLASAAHVETTLPGNSKNIPLQILSNLYLETGDLGL